MTYNGSESSLSTIKCGVPQGSVLGPLLFLIYINYLGNLSEKLYTIIFADDTNIFCSGKHLSDVERTLNDEMEKVRDWLRAIECNQNSFNYFLPKEEEAC